MSKISIVIPTYKQFENCLKPCLESIVQHTDFQDVEVIVVANGCKDDGTREFVQSLGHPFRLVWIEEAAGFTHSTNEGIKASSGEYIVLLNNDSVIMGRNWLDILIKPFLQDEMVGITGAAKNYHKETNSEFVLFFCAMIKRNMFDRFGLLDEQFNPGYGEDIDFCNKVRRHGFKVLQVPNDITLSDLRPRDQHTLQFPIWHKGSITVHTVPTWSQVVPRNEQLLLERYGNKASMLNIGNLLDTISHANVPSTIDRITSFMTDDGVIFGSIDGRTFVTLSKTGFFHHVFVGKDGINNLKKSDILVDTSSMESIKEHVIQSGSKGIAQFGGVYEGGYCTQQDPEEIASYLFNFKDLSVDSYLEIGVAEGGVTRLFCDVVDVKDVTTIDIGWSDANYPFTYRNNLYNLRNTGKINVFRGDARSKHAEEFLSDKTFDFIFIDADHTYDSVVKDTFLAMKHASDGAIFAYHDHVAVDEIARFHKDMLNQLIPNLTPIKSIGNKFGISLFRYSSVSKLTLSTKLKTSIIIPTYNHLEDCLKPCLRSIINTTDLSNTEVIVVANGCTDGTEDYVKSLGAPFKLISIKEQAGFIKATNAGIRAATGHYIVFLNNDTEVVRRDWLDILKAPFVDEKVGITGPYKDWRFFWDNDRLIFRSEYMVFYCAMTTKDVLSKIGELDDRFGMGYEEDIDFAVRLKKAGYKVVQVPDDIEDHLGITKPYLIANPNYNAHNFPLLHKDKMTFKNEPQIQKSSVLSIKYPRPEVSIIIPTYNHSDLLKKCLESVKKYTNLETVEVIVVANGCTDDTREYVQSLGEPFKLLWMKDRAGYIKAMNAGIDQAMGDVIVFLNNDVELLNQEKDAWLTYIISPLLEEGAGICGPVKAYRDDVKRHYILFWCAAIKREVFEKIGKLDEAFGDGYHEDTDFCIRAENAGFKLIEASQPFPIIHQGGGTFAEIYGQSEERLQKHVNKLYQKHLYGELPEGWFGEDDQEFYRKLFMRLPNNAVVVEVGVWKGRSICSVADIIKKKNIRVHCVDTFEGSTWEGKDGATPLNSLLIHDFKASLQRFQLTDYVTVHQSDSVKAASLFADNSLDFIFIDGDHRYEGVQADIKAYLPKMKKNAWMSGHDILWGDSVGPAVWDFFGKDKVYSWANIWYVIPENRPSNPAPDRPKVYDCFPFFNELDVLDIRLNELNDVVDYFVLVEAKETHQGQPKPLFFEENKGRFNKFLPKIRHIVVDNFEGAQSTWDREHAQRNAIERGLWDVKDDDIIIMSDADEIVKKETLLEYNPEMGVAAVQMPLFYYRLNWKIEEPWFKPRIFTWAMQKGKPIQWYRGQGDYQYNTTLQGGWHFSFLGDAKDIKYKIQSYSHSEFNNDFFTNDQNILDAIEKGQDIFKRNLTFKRVDIDDSFPEYVQKNQDKFTPLITKKSSKVFDCVSFFNEVELLQIRLNELNPYVDYFVISEMNQTHSGKDKALNFKENEFLFRDFLHKIIYVVPPNITTEDPWIREHYQRDYMINVLKEKANDNDVIILSDLDEIPRGSKIKEYINNSICNIMAFEQNQYSYYLNYNVGISPLAPGTFSRIATWKTLKDNLISLTGLRYQNLSEACLIKDGGWHFSWMGGANNIATKLESWAHSEFDKPEFKDTIRIEKNIKSGNEHFGRDERGKTTKVAIDKTFPEYIQNNQDYFIELEMIDADKQKVAIIMPYYNDPHNLLKSVSGITSQSFNNWELFIVDDGSDEDKKAVKILASHPKIHHLTKNNGGPSSARNLVLDMIMADKQLGITHIAFCDSDDIWNQDYLTKQLKALGDNDMVYCSVNHVFENGEKAVPFGIPDPEIYPGGEVMLETPFIFISSVLCKRETIGFNRFDSKLDSVEDWEMWLRLDKQGHKICYNQEKLVTYTVKQGMASKRKQEQVDIIKIKYGRNYSRNTN